MEQMEVTVRLETELYQPRAPHHEAKQCRGPANGHSRQRRHSHTACKVHVGGVDAVLHILGPDANQTHKGKGLT